MKKAFVLFALFSFSACGVHGFSSEAEHPEFKIKHDADVGPYGSESKSSLEYMKSDYEVCLLRYQGMDGYKNFCRNLMMADEQVGNPYEVCMERYRNMPNRDVYCHNQYRWQVSMGYYYP